jgi:AcrR family transcriptional regulator
VGALDPDRDLRPGSTMTTIARRSAWAKRFHGQPREVVAEDQRGRILAALPRAMALHGYGGLSVRHLIEPAGVSRRTFYDLYRGLAEAFVAAHEEILVLLCARADAACAAQADWPLKVRAGVIAALDLAAAEPLRVRLLVAEPLTAGPRLAYCHDLLVERFAPRLRQGRRDSGATLPPMLEEALIGGIAGVLADHLRSDRVASLSGLAPQLVELTLTPYIGAAEAKRVARS